MTPEITVGLQTITVTCLAFEDQEKKISKRVKIIILWFTERAG